MEITTLSKLQEETEIIFTHDGMLVFIPSCWIVEGEDRLSYTTLVRLIECCREYHWQKDVIPGCSGALVDSISKSLVANFIKPILAGSQIKITYSVLSVGDKSYRIGFQLQSSNDCLHAKFELIQIFYDPMEHKSIEPPIGVRERLLAICINE